MSASSAGTAACSCGRWNRTGRRGAPSRASRIAFSGVAAADGGLRRPRSCAAARSPWSAFHSIDYGVMEKADDVRMVEATFKWSDLGGWLALEEFLDATSRKPPPRTHGRTGGANLVFSRTRTNWWRCSGCGTWWWCARVSGHWCGREHAEEIKELVQLLERDGQEGTCDRHRTRPSAPSRPTTCAAACPTN